MHFYNLIKELASEKIILFVDMDGVIASYDFGKPLDFKNKRPLYNNIEVLKKVSTIDNVELHILSVCRKNYQIEEKNEWLDIYAPFFKKENRHILSKETIIGYACDGQNSGFLIKIPEEYMKYYINYDEDNPNLLKVTHITASLAKGASASNTKNLKFELFDKPYLVKGKFGYWIKKDDVNGYVSFEKYGIEQRM